VSTAVTDGTIKTSGSLGWWAAISGASLYAHGSISAGQTVTAGNTFQLSSFELRIANQ
jgi:hypothetical protein